MKPRRSAWLGLERGPRFLCRLGHLMLPAKSTLCLGAVWFGLLIPYREPCCASFSLQPRGLFGDKPNELTLSLHFAAQMPQRASSARSEPRLRAANGSQHRGTPPKNPGFLLVSLGINLKRVAPKSHTPKQSPHAIPVGASPTALHL